MSEGKRLIQIGKHELLVWASSLLQEELTWKSFSDGRVFLRLCFLVWPNLTNTKAEIDSLADSWSQIEAIFRTLSIDYSKLIDEDGIKSDKLCSAYNAMIIFFFLYHCAFKNESSFEFIPPPSRQIVDFLMGDSSIKTLIVGGSLQLSPKTQIKLFEKDSKIQNNPEVANEQVRHFKGDDGVYYDRIQRFNEIMEMDERTVKLAETLTNFFEGLNERLSEMNRADLPQEIEDFTAKVRRTLEYCVRQIVRTKEEQAIERESFENRIKVVQEEAEKKIEQVKLTYEEKIRELENENKQKLIQEKKASRSMLRTLQNNQTLNLQMSTSEFKGNSPEHNSSDGDSPSPKSTSLEQLKYLQQIVHEENKKRDEIEKALNEEIISYQEENKKLRYIIYRYVVDVSSTTPQFERTREISDQFVKIYTMAESWWKTITDGSENLISERPDLNYKMERMRMDEVLGYLKHILDKYQEYPKALNKVGLGSSKKTSNFEFEVIVQNNHLVNDCLRIICDLISDSLLKTNLIEQLKDVILHSNNQSYTSFQTQCRDENQCYCNANDIFGSVYGKIVCGDEKKHLKEKVQHLNHEKLLLQRGIEFLKKKLYTLKNKNLIVSSQDSESNLDLMTSIDKPLGEIELSSQDIIDVSDLWEVSQFLKEDGIGDLGIMSEFLVIINRWKSLVNYTSLEGNLVPDFHHQGTRNQKPSISFGKPTIRGMTIIPFITNSNRLIEIALENDFTQTEFFEEVKKLESHEFDLNGDFEKEVQLISKIASNGNVGKSESFQESSLPYSLTKIEIMFWKLVTCLHILREEYEMLYSRNRETQGKLEVLLATMEEEKEGYRRDLQESQERQGQLLHEERNERLRQIGKLKAQVTSSKIEKFAALNKPGKSSVSTESKEKLVGIRKMIETLSVGLEVSNSFRFIYQISDELWSSILESIKGKFDDPQLEERISEVQIQLQGVKEHLKEYGEKQISSIQDGARVKEKEDISEYVSSKIMEIRDHSDMDFSCPTLDEKVGNFFKEMVVRNKIPLDWLQFVEILVEGRTIELNNELDSIREQLKERDEVIVSLKEEYIRISQENSDQEANMDSILFEKSGLEEKLASSIRELDDLRTSNQMLIEKFKQVDSYYTNQLLSCNKRLNCLEKIYLLSSRYGVKMEYFQELFSSEFVPDLGEEGNK
ncbi:coiled coil protein [Cryptosporidium felis]|nr:coiled coil protein [Cryptosporidium felis]